MVLYSSRLLVALPVLLSMLSAQDFDETDYREAALQTTLACLKNTATPSQGSPIIVSIHPAFIKADITNNSDNKNLLPTLEIRWSVSPNLGIMGGFGMNNIDGDLIRWQRYGFSFLAEALALAGFTPRFNFYQGGLSGFASYETNWNQLDWIFGRSFGSWHTQLGVTVLYQNVFLRGSHIPEGIARRFEINKNYLRLGVGYDFLPWLNLDGFGIFGKLGRAIGLQINLAS